MRALHKSVGEKMKSQSKWLVTGIATVILVASLTAFFFETQLGSRAQNTVRVACVGDSITHDTEYPDDLGRMLGANYTVGNFGVGRTTVSLQFNKPYLKQTAFQDAQRFEPDIVVIMLGTNDAYLSEQQRSNFTSDYKTLVALLQACPSEPEIFVVVPPPVFNNTMGLHASILDDDVIPLIKQTANDLDLPLIDVYTPLVNYPEAFQDGVHPNSQGAKIVATQIFDAIT
jgi:lysophospholipase L1-like esterase